MQLNNYEMGNNDIIMDLYFHLDSPNVMVVYVLHCDFIYVVFYNTELCHTYLLVFLIFLFFCD